jgi:hypothetical protein
VSHLGRGLTADVSGRDALIRNNDCKHLRKRNPR